MIETIRIGRFKLIRIAEGKIWTDNMAVKGEGGEFSEAEIEEIIARFYADNL